MNSFICSIGKDLVINVGGYEPLIFCEYFSSSNAANFLFKSIQLASSKHQIVLATMAFSAISSNWQCPFLKIFLYIYLKLH